MLFSILQNFYHFFVQNLQKLQKGYNFSEGKRKLQPEMTERSFTNNNCPAVRFRLPDSYKAVDSRYFLKIPAKALDYSFLKT